MERPKRQPQAVTHPVGGGPSKPKTTRCATPVTEFVTKPHPAPNGAAASRARAPSAARVPAKPTRVDAPANSAQVAGAPGPPASAGTWARLVDGSPAAPAAAATGAMMLPANCPGPACTVRMRRSTTNGADSVTRLVNPGYSACRSRAKPYRNYLSRGSNCHATPRSRTSTGGDREQQPRGGQGPQTVENVTSGHTEVTDLKRWPQVVPTGVGHREGGPTSDLPTTGLARSILPRRPGRKTNGPARGSGSAGPTRTTNKAGTPGRPTPERSGR